MAILDPLNGITAAETSGNTTRMGSRPEGPVGPELVMKLPVNSVTAWRIGATDDDPDGRTEVGLYRHTSLNGVMDPGGRGFRFGTGDAARLAYLAADRQRAAGTRATLAGINQRNRALAAKGWK